MIKFNYETDFKLQDEVFTSEWISNAIAEELCQEGEINYIFCNDDYLLDFNVKFLSHDTFTDIISFDYSVGKELHGDIFISIDRVKENADQFKVDFQQELHRVIIHGVLHYCGYNDKLDDEKLLMRAREEHYLSRLNLS